MAARLSRLVWFGLAAAGVLAAAGLSDQEKEDFLRKAKVISAKELSVGVTLSRRLTLSDGAFTHDAHFQDIDAFKPLFEGARGNEPNFRDSYRYNILAYRLDRLLGLGMTPVSIERKYGGQVGAFTWWIDDVLMMELERWKKRLAPPDKETWNDQMYQARVFNELVYNTDPNLGNVLIDKSWKVWLIDFTRGFRLQKTLKNPENLGRIDRRIWENLQRLDEARLRGAFGATILEGELSALVARREALVRYFNQRIAAEGQVAVVCDLPGH